MARPTHSGFGWLAPAHASRIVLGCFAMVTIRPAMIGLATPDATVDHGLQVVKFGLNLVQLSSDHVMIGDIIDVIVMSIGALSLGDAVMIDAMVFEHFHSVVDSMA